MDKITNIVCMTIAVLTLGIMIFVIKVLYAQTAPKWNSESQKTHTEVHSISGVTYIIFSNPRGEMMVRNYSADSIELKINEKFVDK